jgi:hypothetical protein
MKKLLIIICSGCYYLASCDNTTSSETKKENGPLMNEIVGAYVRDYSFEVKNMSTDQVVGIKSVRDTIFIKEKENGFEVSNSKHRMNDYDQDGWIEITGTERMPTFQATYDQLDNSLVPVQNPYVAPVYFDSNNDVIYKDKDRNHPYQKVQ